MNHVYPDFPAHGGNGGVSTRTYIATHAMMGLLADHKDHEDELRWHWETDKGEVCDAAYIGPRKQVFDESCVQAVARIAVEHADALIAELNKQAGGAS